MPFPIPGTAWPPVDNLRWFQRMQEWSAWFSGDPQQLLDLYSSESYFPDTEQGRFWARMEASERSGCVHLPVAGDIAATSANLLFSEAPIFSFDEEAPGGDRIIDFMKENGFLNQILEAAELATALSGVFLKLDVEPELVKIPVLSIITPLQAIPYFWRGRLWEVLFFRTVLEEHEGSVVWRMFELRRRENGKLVIEYRLYKGAGDRVGNEMELKAIDETANLGLENITYDMDGLGCVYIPNMRPNRLMPGSPLGINDYSGVITLMDSLDFAWTSWMRDIELGMAQLLIDEELLEHSDGSATTQETESRAKFNKFQKAFIKLNLSPWRMSGENIKPIEQVQFDIRTDDHMKTCENLLFQIVNQCGYSPQTFGIVDQGGRMANSSGTAMRIRERKSLLTREKKSRYWQPELRRLFYQMQQLDLLSNLAPKSYVPQEVDVTLQDSILTDELEKSETIRNLEQARAASTYTKVKMLHPEWEEKKIEEEVKLILDDQGVTPPPFE